ncbi:hypothetical protein M413DRAFT_387085 [Hebeloma cylindrosporum]|uniref:Aminoglycoside phosphotransferase domain-containing protein n=1 Tax=Hebeloma cylindrosporum TaxID=76867 RepID=A0A0C3CHU7_HEBCY|nr:hypothetical protein M413DRAFT_387085 [Hebeloma cylindrosporum h7]
MSGTLPVLTTEQAEVVVRKHLAGHTRSVVWQITEIKNKGYSFTSRSRTYILDLAPANSRGEDIALPPCSCFLTIESPTTPSESEYRTNTLELVSHVLSLIRSNTDIPIPQSILDITLELVPFHFLLSPASPIASNEFIPLSIARKSGQLSLEETLLIDLQIGKFLGQLHSGVQNDWFGLPQLNEPKEPSYSWQEKFTLLLETLLSECQSREVDLPYEEIRRYLSRAIGFFLFDDVDVPSLVWLTGSEDDIYVFAPAQVQGSPNGKESGIAAILPNVAHALWGDPLLETFFLPPAPSTAVLEGYTGSGGGHLNVFPRQKTKRLWYTVFLALVVLREREAAGLEIDSSGMPSREWAVNLIHDAVLTLKDAPCY